MTKIKIPTRPIRESLIDGIVDDLRDDALFLKNDRGYDILSTKVAIAKASNIRSTKARMTMLESDLLEFRADSMIDSIDWLPELEKCSHCLKILVPGQNIIVDEGDQKYCSEDCYDEVFDEYLSEEEMDEFGSAYEFYVEYGIASKEVYEIDTPEAGDL